MPSVPGRQSGERPVLAVPETFLGRVLFSTHTLFPIGMRKLDRLGFAEK